MKKIVILPLDERPCNYKFPKLLPTDGCSIIMPPIDILGDKKKPAKIDLLHNWLLHETIDADYLVLSMDMLLYGGIVPSRLHYSTENILIERTKIVHKIKENNPNIKIYGFQLIMRCPWYSLNDEEPEYYEEYGSEIHRSGRYKHMSDLNIMTDQDYEDLELVNQKLDLNVLDDYLNRREINLNILKYSLEYLKKGIFDYFVIPQDDAAVYGYTSMDQIIIRDIISNNFLQSKVSMYPSADDIGMTLLSRAINDFNGLKPKIYVYYASSKGAFVIPSFEDRIIDETIKYHIIASGSVRVYSMHEAEIVLAVNIGSSMLNPNENGYETAYRIERNLIEFIEQIKYAKQQNKLVALCDVAHANGGDMEMLKILSQENLTFTIDAYAGWNTSSNTIGTSLSQVISYFYSKKNDKNINFLLHRYYEDVAYCSYVRKHITETKLPKMNLNYFDVGEVDGEVSVIIKKAMLEFMKVNFEEIYNKSSSIEIKMPWKRMFEIDLKVK